MTEVLRNFGLIGYGAWGKCHAEAIRNTAGAELKGIVAKSESSRQQAAQDFPQAQVYSSVDDLIANAEIDIVDIVLPSYLHFDVASQVLRAGKDLLLEKPMCLEVAQCKALISIAKQHHCLLAIGHELRFSSLWSRVKEMIDEGYIGDPKYLLVELSRKPYRLGAEGWRYDIDRVGNWILEEPIHFFDFARWYMSACGEPKQVFAVANSIQEGHPELQDNFSATLRFENGAYAVISQSLSMFEHHQIVKVAGTKGSLWASWSGAMDRTRHPRFFLKASQGDVVEDIKIDKITGEVFELEDQIAMLVQAKQDPSVLRATGEDGMWSVAMCMAAQASVDAGQPIAISDVM